MNKFSRDWWDAFFHSGPAGCQEKERTPHTYSWEGTDWIENIDGELVAAAAAADVSSMSTHFLDPTQHSHLCWKRKVKIDERAGADYCIKAGEIKYVSALPRDKTTHVISKNPG